MKYICWLHLLIKYIKSVLWRVVKRLPYIEDARCLKVNELLVCMKYFDYTKVNIIVHGHTQNCYMKSQHVLITLLCQANQQVYSYMPLHCHWTFQITPTRQTMGGLYHLNNFMLPLMDTNPGEGGYRVLTTQLKLHSLSNKMYSNPPRMGHIWIKHNTKTYQKQGCCGTEATA